jgi:hypothetical protein
MPTFQEKSEVDDTRVESRHYGGLGLKIRWNFRYNAPVGRAPSRGTIARFRERPDAGLAICPTNLRVFAPPLLHSRCESVAISVSVNKDRLTKARRSWNMSRIKGENTASSVSERTFLVGGWPVTTGIADTS